MAQRPPAAVFGDGSHGTVSAPSVTIQNTSRVVTEYDRRVPKGPVFGDARCHFSAVCSPMLLCFIVPPVPKPRFRLIEFLEVINLSFLQREDRELAVGASYLATRRGENACGFDSLVRSLFARTAASCSSSCLQRGSQPLCSLHSTWATYHTCLLATCGNVQASLTCCSLCSCPRYLHGFTLCYLLPFYCREFRILLGNGGHHPEQEAFYIR